MFPIVALEQTLRVTGDREAFFWATYSGAELDLLVHWAGKRWGFEFKYSSGPAMTRSLHVALEDLKPERIFVIYTGHEVYPLHERVEAVPLAQLRERLEHFGAGKGSRRIRKRRGRTGTAMDDRKH